MKRDMLQSQEVVPSPSPARPRSLRVSKEVALSELDDFRVGLGVEGERCMLCALGRHETKDVVLETDLAQVRLDRYGCSEGHLMVVARQHVEHTHELSWSAYAHLQELAYQASHVIEQAFRPKRVFIASLGAPKALAQSYPHFHIHVVPVFHDDERARPAHVLSWSSGVTVYTDEQAAHLTAGLAATWRTLFPGAAAPIASLPVGQTRPRPSAAHWRRLTAPVRNLVSSLLALTALGACSSPAPSTDPGREVILIAPAGTSLPESATGGQAPEFIASEPDTIVVGPSSVLHPRLATAMDELPARPVVTGTLLATTDGRNVFASDVDRDAVFQVTLPERSVRRLAVGAGDQPGQLVEVGSAEGGTTRVFVALRAAGAVMAMAPETGETSTYDVCSSPRGLAFQASPRALHVACESGELVTLDPDTGATLSLHALAPDLRDVQVFGETLLVSRYRSAELLVVDETGTVVSRTVPNPSPNCASSAVMHRMVARGPMLYLAHQLGTHAALGTSSGGYGAAGCAAASLEPMVQATDDVASLQGGELEVLHTSTSVTLASSGGSVQLPAPSNLGSQPNRLSMGLAGRAGPLDLAVSSSGRVAATFTGDSLWPGASALITLTPLASPTDERYWEYSEHATTGMLTAVTFDGNGQWIAQSREPALLEFEDGTTLSLDPQSAANTGLDLFYVNTGSGLSCAGCHPEGDEDGRTWAFAQGLRRTQSLSGGVMGRAPFHWDGEMPEMATLVKDVMNGRMAFRTTVNEEQVAVFGRWLDTIPAPVSMLGQVSSDASQAAERGRDLFFDETLECAACHSGDDYADDKAYDVGTGGVFYTPTLLGIGLRNAFMHDGCATTLSERFGLCGGGDQHGKTSHLSEAQLDDLVTFMQTL